MTQHLPQAVKGLNKLRKFLSKDYRDGFMQTQVRSGIAYQMQAMRRKLGITQTQMSEKVGKPQSVISRLEDVEYGGVSVQSLLDIASRLDIALLVQFVSYPEFLSRTKDMSDKALQPETIAESVRRHDHSGKGKSPHLSIVVRANPISSQGKNSWRGQSVASSGTQRGPKNESAPPIYTYDTSGASKVKFFGAAQ